MTHKSLALLAALPALLVPALATPGGSSTVATAPTQQSADLTALVTAEAKGAAARDVRELWERAGALRSAARLADDGELDRILDRQLGETETLSPQARILLAASRLQGDDPDAGVLLDALEPLVLAKDDEIARAAAALFGDKTFKALNRTKRDQLLDALQAAADDPLRSPSYRLDFAAAAYRLGGGSARRQANEVMQSFLQSDDPELQAQGALAIAGSTEADITGRLRDVLEQLALVPNERGSLARAYLEIERNREYSERKLRDARAALADKTMPPEFEELFTVKKLISDWHLEGEKVTEEDLMNAAVDGMLSYMDQHSSFLSSEQYAKFFQDLEAEYGGIGAYVRNDSVTSLFTIVRPIYSGPAYEAGLQTDDVIVKIGDWPTIGQPEDEIIKRLKGTPGTTAELYIWRRGMDTDKIDRPTEDMKVVVERAQIEIPAGSHQLLPGGIGLIELTTFSKVSQDQMKIWIKEMLGDGMRALILDMRRNSGGLLTEAREVADLFLPPGQVVVKTESRNRKPDVETTVRKALVPEDMPVVILTSRMTASAAEIVSGALQDHKRAKLVGNRTYGKGSVQQLVPILTDRQDEIANDANHNGRLDEGETLSHDWNGNGKFDYCPRVKLTIARYLLPSGRSIHRELDREGNLLSEGGIAPDYEVDLPLIERWRFDEREKIRTGDPKSNVFTLKEYLDKHYEANKELFHRLAVNDFKDPSLYPDFDQLMVALETPLSRDDVRDVLRREVRRRVQDDLGREFPFGDFVEDPQVQKAIEVALGELGEEPKSLSEYDLVFDLERINDSRSIATLRRDEMRDIGRVKALLQGAKEGGATLDDASIDELLDLIDKIEAAEEN